MFVQNERTGQTGVTQSLTHQPELEFRIFNLIHADRINRTV